MDGQFHNGVAIVNLQNPGEFLRIRQPNPGLDTDGVAGQREKFIQKTVQPIRIRQHSRTLILCNHSAGGTAEVNVDLRIAERSALFHRPGHILGVFAQQLRNCREIHAVGGGNLPGLPVSKAAMDGGGDKGHIISVNAGEIFVVQPPESGVSDTLHGGVVNVHQTSR